MDPAEQALYEMATRRARRLRMVRHGVYATLIVSSPFTLSWLIYVIHTTGRGEAVLKGALAIVTVAVALALISIVAAFLARWWVDVFNWFQRKYDDGRQR